MVNYKNVMNLIHAVSDFSQFEKPIRIKVLDKFLSKVLKFLRIIVFVSVTSALYVAIFDKNCVKYRLDTDYTSTCNLIMEYYVPFKVNRYQQALMTIFQLFSLTIAGEVILIYIIFMYYTFELLTIRLEDISMKINDIKFDGDKEKSFKKLQLIIMYHQHTFRIFHMATPLINKLIVGYRFCIVISNTLLVGKIMLNPDIRSIELFIIGSGVLLMHHTVGQRIINYSSTVKDAIYNTNWYDADVATQKDILTFLCMLQQPFYISYNMFGSLGYAALTNDCKKMYACLNSMIKILNR
ncbi:uncharacterized protein [Onthophagus taurus]|uniref:uncharacterized protein n=1 Tax=Onthophagus taurus TaxID=166361 RepID=UPI0039BE245E